MKLTEDAKQTIRSHGLTLADYYREWFGEPRWFGDKCGCPDDRCIGYHHDEHDECGCVTVCAQTAADNLR